MNENFVAINLIDGDGKALVHYPIIYFWDGDNTLEESLYDKDFINYITPHITTSNFHNSFITLIYTFKNDNEDILYHQDKFFIKDLYNLDIFDLKKKYLWEILNFLYKCAYKTDYNDDHETKFDVVGLYKSLVSKYPKKINETVVSNFIQSKLKDNYENISNDEIKQINQIFIEEINNN